MSEDIEGMTNITPAQSEAQGEPAADYVWGWNGIRPDGEKFSIDPVRFIMFAQECHPEWIDEDTGEILVMDIVLNAQDAAMAGDDALAGTVAVTIRPDLGYSNFWATSAREAANRYPANPKVRERFKALSDMLCLEGFDKVL